MARAELGHRGYTREISPDGAQPLIYDYDYVDPAPLASFPGKLTRYGDVAPLLRSDDDQLCLVGPGDEVRSSFRRRNCRRCRRAGRAAMCCEVSGIARTPTRSRPPAIRSSRSRGGRCRRSRSVPASSGRMILRLIRICAHTRLGPPAEAISRRSDVTG